MRAMFEATTETTPLHSADECGHTNLLRESVRPFFRSSDGPDEIEAVRLFRCVREPDHDGEHFGIEVYKNETTMLWQEAHPDREDGEGDASR